MSERGKLTWAVVQGQAIAGPTPAQRCASTKRALAGKKIRGLSSCDVRAVLRGVAVDAGCVSKAKAKFVAGWDHAEARGGCATSGDAASVETTVDAHNADLQNRLGVTGPASRCTSGKFRDAGEKGACKLGCAAKAVLKGLPFSDPKIASCLGACTTHFTAAFAKDEGAGDCHTLGDTAAIEFAVDAFAADVTTALPETTTTSTTSTTSSSTTTATTAPSTTTTTSSTMTTSTIGGTTTTTTTSTTTSSIATTTTSTSTSTTVPAFCSPTVPLLPLGSVKFTTSPGTTSCGGLGFAPGPSAPFSGEVDDGGGAKLTDLGLGCLEVGASLPPGERGVLPPSSLTDGSTSVLDVSGVNGLQLTLGASSGSGQADCTKGAGPGRHCVNGAPGTDGAGACGQDADCGGASGTCDLDANCYFGPPLPVPAGVFSTCVLNVFAADACGSADVVNGGSAALFVSLQPRLYLTSNGDAPCPQCVNGTCTDGPRAGLGCSAVGTTQTSLDCPPFPSEFVGAFSLTASPLSTGTSTLTDATGLFCPGQAQPGAFGLSAARTVLQTGVPLLGSTSLFSMTVAGNLCLPATGNALIDGVLNLPGPASLSVPGTAQVCLLGALCL